MRLSTIVSSSPEIVAVANSLQDQRSLRALTIMSEGTDEFLHTVVMAQSTCDDHLAIVSCLLALGPSPDTLPRLRLGFRGRIAISAYGGEEVFAGDSLHGLFVMRSHLQVGSARSGVVAVVLTSHARLKMPRVELRGVSRDAV